jgi:hypothetical protein
MPYPSRLIEVDPVHSSDVLLALAGAAVGLVEGVGAVTRATTRLGSRLWERLFSWALCAAHDPLRGQEVGGHLVRDGRRVGALLLLAAVGADPAGGPVE